ncbi:MAG TPA: hypothetical protein VFE03_01845 [Caulobacteraceae bacterium]|nr:hypothetical protein [Caulobacteraceae bacterium]
MLPDVQLAAARARTQRLLEDHASALTAELWLGDTRLATMTRQSEPSVGATSVRGERPAATKPLTGA